MLVQFGNNWIQKIPRTAKLDEAVIWQSSEFFSSNYFQIGQHVVLLHILIIMQTLQRNVLEITFCSRHDILSGSVVLGSNSEEQ